jgi:hypothetical protein
VRRVALVACIVGCGYPEFGFTAEGQAGDSAVVDSAIADTQPIFSNDGEVTDSAVAMETPTTGGCSKLGMHLFCRDFDTVVNYREGWGDEALTAPLGKLSLDPGGHSGPHALKAETQADGAGIVLANLFHIFTAPSAEKPVRGEAWMKLDVPTSTAQGGYLMKVSRAGDGVALSLGPSGLYAETSGGDYPIAKPVPVGAWFHVRIDAVLAPSTGSFSIYIDDMEKPALSKTAVTTASMVSTERKIAVGLYSAKATTNMKVLVDDVTFDILP